MRAKANLPAAGRDASFVKLKMTFGVVEARIEAREVKLDARASFIESLASIRAASPITVSGHGAFIRIMRRAGRNPALLFHETIKVFNDRSLYLFLT